MLYDLPHVASGTRTACMIYHTLFGMDPYHADPAQPLAAASGELDGLR